MLLSMTGFGNASASFGGKKINVEIKSLNGKSTDVRLKSPIIYREKEIELRKIVQTGALRGKIEVAISTDGESADDQFSLDSALFKRYHAELNALATELNLPESDIMNAILKMPNVVKNPDIEVAPEEWDFLKSLIGESLENLSIFRKEEGASLEKDFEERITNISQYLTEVEPFEEARIEKLKSRLQTNLADFVGQEKIDENRFEQEVLFYMEKLDINEEKVRLAQHCKFFIEELKTDDPVKGRKLSFIAQEIGREINTMGAKAQFTEIQHLVVRMKDELEKIKEQVANII